jgi:ABC-type multidrug transport system fused ATPase/permease subunit
LSQRIETAGKVAAISLRQVTDLIGDIQALAKLTRIYKSKSLESFLERKRTIRVTSTRSMAFLEQLPRNLMEVTLIIGVFVISLSTYIFMGEEKVSAALTLFAAASFRLLPSFNRIQASILLIFSSATMAEKALIARRKNDIILNISAPQIGEVLSPIDSPRGAADELAVVEVKNVSFKYPDASSFVLMDISLNFLVGKQYAIVGESGSGKTTLADLILGLMPPTSGRISLRKGTHQAQLGYVPQTTYTFEGSLARNITLEWDDELIDSTKLDLSIAGAALDRLIGDQDPRKFPANRLSGGQSQRVGIARALYREPLLIVLDEATNSLDSETEDEVLHALGALRGKVTIVMIAHSMRTIQNADEVIMVDKGHVIGTGSFSELRKKCEKFDALVESGKLFEI